jgi:hypothetical protein
LIYLEHDIYVFQTNLFIKKFRNEDYQ